MSSDTRFSFRLQILSVICSCLLYYTNIAIKCNFVPKGSLISSPIETAVHVTLIVECGYAVGQIRSQVESVFT